MDIKVGTKVKDWSRNLDGIYADDLKEVHHLANFDIVKIT